MKPLIYTCEGAPRSVVDRPEVRAACLVQMVARAVRRCLCRDWRASTGQEQGKTIAAAWMNTVLGLTCTDRSTAAGSHATCSGAAFFWGALIKERVATQFDGGVDEDERPWAYDLRESLRAAPGDLTSVPVPVSRADGVRQVAQLVCKLAGVVLHDTLASYRTYMISPLAAPNHNYA